jgi:PAS domain S-box-containing protein
MPAYQEYPSFDLTPGAKRGSKRMTNDRTKPLGKGELRRRAEEELKRKGEKRPADDQDPRARDQMQRLIHELQVHQIELEMQNDELRAAQERIEESRSGYEDLYDFSPLGYFTFDRTGVIQALNLTGAKLLGKERRSLIKSPFSRFIDEKFLNVFLSHLEAVFETGTRQSCELWLETKGRSRVPVAMESIRTEEDHGEIGQCRSAILDITKRKRAEEALHQAERYQHLAAEVLRILNNPSTLDGSVGLILDAITRETGLDAVGIRLRNGGGDLPYIVQNSFSRDFLLAEDTLIARDGCGDPCRNGSGEITLECPGGLVMSGRTDPANPSFTTGGSFWTNDVLPLPDLPAGEDLGSRSRNTCIHQGYKSMALIPIRANREIVGLLQLNDRRKDRFTLEMVRLFEGIAESIGIALIRKQTERLLEKRSTQLEDANKELESFSYSVSHDLRTPLRAIDGFSRVILKRKGDQFDPETKRQFELIREGAERMNRLIDNILALSRVGSHEKVVSRIDMEQLVRETWEALCEIHPGRQFDWRAEPLPPAMGDRMLIAQVLTNLLSNAIKYSATRDISIIEVGGHATERETVYSIKDNGVGFEMAYYPKLFKVFQRLHSNAEFEGTGVGLSIVQRIIHRHGGRVWAEAEKEKGATFSFALPIRQG